MHVLDDVDLEQSSDGICGRRFKRTGSDLGAKASEMASSMPVVKARSVMPPTT